ncbi:hypothetical protein A2127_00560 [Candidatus Jorgensenbacteria bacterium GWC1_48_12]|uniref:Cohesin domain-containing protein n=3 Tax=Parcubacteria group TaxID=1794811 RepID=A0A1F6BMK1_9BACT|nr:MAG: hypothetical protein UV10_C0022G0003 [Candidatus Azambacteria bacterium GW2011_GWA1_42_19]OGD41882.1 MAG: hypothetical protein A2567_00595 [Candidatus Azambacteria bacterium RIFOXYD1_FULL_42_11]OGG38149.1 MAG: hypothetical protein A2127_00560 [Candidatus Jorgensenbacteria bacterium GWC1_48_12]
MVVEEIKITKKLILALLFCVGLALPARGTGAATLYFSPSSGTYNTGRNFTVSVKVSTNVPVNAVSAVINYPNNNLEAVGISKTGSVVNLWVQEPSFSNTDSLGNVRFEGVVLNPGFTGEGGVLDITFRVKAKGGANLNFFSGTVLANDGKGTNVLSTFKNAKFSLETGAALGPQELGTSGLPSLPFVRHYIKNKDGNIVFAYDSNSDGKYVNHLFNKFEWLIPPGVVGMAILLNDRPSSNPGSKSDGFFDSKTYELDDGIYYFHIRFISALGAGPVLHHKFIIDTVPPADFNIIFPTGSVTTNPTPRFRLSAEDDVGIDYYQIKIDDGDFFDAKGLFFLDDTYLAPKLSPGNHSITARAYDFAGNYMESVSDLTISPTIQPKIIEYPNNVLLPVETLIIKGTSLPSSKIEVYLNRDKYEPIVFDGAADKNGNWQAIYKEEIPPGVYKVSAKQFLENGAESLLSDPVYVGVNSRLWRFYQYFKNISVFLSAGLAIIVILLVGAVYYLYKKRGGKNWRLSKKEVREVKDTVSSGFKKLRKDIKRREEPNRVLKDISKIEKDIEEEIKDVEK